MSTQFTWCDECDCHHSAESFAVLHGELDDRYTAKQAPEILYAREMREAMEQLFEAIQGDPAEVYRLDAEFSGACSRAMKQALVVLAKVRGENGK